MARSRSKAQAEQVLLDDEQRPSLPPAPRKGPVDRDPREPLPTGAIEGEHLGPLQPRRLSEDLFTRYARELVAAQGNVVLALAQTYGISEEEAAKDIVALHARARGASRANTSVGDMIERHDLSVEVRLARLREMLFHPNPAVALKAIDQLNEMDATAKSRRIGTTWESLVKRVRADATKALTR